MIPDVGEDIYSVCRPCGGTRWHIIVAKVGSKIVKCQCKECGREHRFKDPDGPKKKAAKPKRASTGTKAKGTTRKKGRKYEDLNPLVDPDVHTPAVTYKMNLTFYKGQRIVHTKFGPGVVEDIISPKKVRVFFNGERRVLMQDMQRP